LTEEKAAVTSPEPFSSSSRKHKERKQNSLFVKRVSLIKRVLKIISNLIILEREEKNQMSILNCQHHDHDH
jgi:hypothetical protein